MSIHFCGRADIEGWRSVQYGAKGSIPLFADDAAHLAPSEVDL